MKKLFVFLLIFTSLTAFCQTNKSLDEIVQENKGKVILVDFWASWCKPCRSEMKKLPSFKEKLKGKDVVYVFISMDAEKDRWEKAMEAEGVVNDINLLISQAKDAKVLEGHKVMSIPRYMVIDKKGKLVSAHAPGYSRKLIKVINKYLEE